MKFPVLLICSTKERKSVLRTNLSVVFKNDNDDLTIFEQSSWTYIIAVLFFSFVIILNTVPNTESNKLLNRRNEAELYIHRRHMLNR